METEPPDDIPDPSPADNKTDPPKFIVPAPPASAISPPFAPEPPLSFKTPPMLVESKDVDAPAEITTSPPTNVEPDPDEIETEPEELTSLEPLPMTIAPLEVNADEPLLTSTDPSPSLPLDIKVFPPEPLDMNNDPPRPDEPIPPRKDIDPPTTPSPDSSFTEPPTLVLNAADVEPAAITMSPATTVSVLEVFGLALTSPDVIDTEPLTESTDSPVDIAISPDSPNADLSVEI